MAAEMLEVFTGACGMRVPLPEPLEGSRNVALQGLAAGAQEAKELLRLNLEATQLSRRWSPWRSLYIIIYIYVTVGSTSALRAFPPHLSQFGPCDSFQWPVPLHRP